MTVTPVVGTASFPRLTPYMSIDMFKNQGRRGVSVDQLVAKGSPADQDAALAGYIDEASAWTDTFCQQTLAATYDTQTKLVNVNRAGYVRIHPRYRPVIAVTAVAMGATLAQAQALTSLAGISVDPDFFEVPVSGTSGLPINTPQGPIQLGNSVIPGLDQVWSQFTYVNGYPVTGLSANVAAGAVLLPVLDTTGIVPGKTWMTVFAGPTRFRFLATSVSTAVGGSIIGTGSGNVGCPALPNAYQNNTTYPVMVSALPQDVISAVTLVTRAFIKDGSGGSQGSTDTTAEQDLDEAAGILRAYIAPIA